MRSKILVAVGVALLAASASAQVCFNETTKQCAPDIFGGCPEGWVAMASCPPDSVTPTPVPTVVPTPEPTPVPNYFESHGIKLSPKSLLKFLAFLTGLVTAVQFLKKVMENLSKWQWLIKLVPPLAAVFAFLSSGFGPLVLNALLTVGTLLPVAATDGLISVLEIASIVGVIIGNDFFYKLIRDLGAIWPKKT